MQDRTIVGEKRPKRSFSSITRKWVLLVVIFTCPAFFLFAYLGDPGRGIVAAGSAGVITITVRYFWDLSKHMWFWITIGFIVLLHVAAIALIRWPFQQYSFMQMLPIALLDFGIMYGIIRLFENTFEKNSRSH